jgi:hypothetical protein
MTRPRRLYTTADGKFYYLIDGKKKFVKAPAGISQKQIARINIKNIVNAPTAKRLKRRRKRIEPAYGKKVGGVLQKSETGGLPIYFFKPQKNIPTIDEIAKASDDTTVDKLAKLLKKGLEAKPSSSKIAATIATQTTPIATPTTAEESKTSEPSQGIQAELSKGKKAVKRYDALATILYRKHEEKGGFPTKESLRNEYDFTDDVYTKGVREAQKRLNTASKNSAVEAAREELRRDAASQPKMSRQSSESSLGSASSAASLGERMVSGLKKLVSGPKVAPVDEEDEIGGGGDGDGLYNDEIEKIVKKRIKNYVPVIASDEINELPRYVARGDKRFGFVINTNPSTSDGSGNDGYRTGHWRAVYINNEDDYPTVEYFDPLAEGKMPPELINMTRRIAMKMNPSMMFKYKQNMLRRQSKLTSNCGHHSIKFLDDRYNGVPWSEATGYDDYMEQHSSAPDDSHDGEKDIAKVIKKYESYI